MDEIPVGIAELKAKLSEYLRAVRNGKTVVVQDRLQPIARLVPFTREKPRLNIRKGTGRLQDIKFPPITNKRIDVLAYLREERGERI